MGSGALLGAIVYPPLLGALDAFRLFRQLAQDIGGRVAAYDKRLAEAARAASIPLVAPA